MTKDIVVLAKSMYALQNGAFESFFDLAEAIKRASELNYRGFIFIGNLIVNKECTVFYEEEGGELKSHNFYYDSEDTASYNMCVLINFLNSHEVHNVRKSISYTIDATRVFSVDFESTLDPHKIAHL